MSWAPPQTPNDGRTASPLGPGLAIVAGAVAVAFAVHAVLDALSPLVVATAIGAILTNLGLVPAAAEEGIAFAGRRLLRAGIVFLGFQLALGEVLDIGASGLCIVLAVVAITFLGTQWLGARMGLSKNLSLLIATGFSICGASAIAAVEGVVEADEEEVAFSIALVTLCGTMAILLLPALRDTLGLDAPELFGSWVGASVHDVGQVVATAASGGPEAVRAAVVVKLTRVILLAPIVAGIGLQRRAAGRGSPAVGVPGKTPPLMPLFVVGFLVAIAVRATGYLGTDTLGVLKHVQDILLASGLFSLGCGVNVAKLRQVGRRPLVLAAASWTLIAATAYLGVRVTGV